MSRTAVLVLFCLAALAVLPASAAITDVPSGGTVFIGEQGLNIVAANVTAGSQIARFSGGNVQTDAPSDLVTVSDPTSFYVSPTQFGGTTGAWYTFPGRQLAFIVKDPSLQLRVINGRTGREIGSGAVAGDPLGFRIETNLDAMAQRPGVAGAPVTIHVRDPTGAEFTSLVNGGVTTSLVNIPVNASVYETGPVWATDTSQYPRRVVRGLGRLQRERHEGQLQPGRQDHDPVADRHGDPGRRHERAVDHQRRHADGHLDRDGRGDRDGGNDDRERDRRRHHDRPDRDRNGGGDVDRGDHGAGHDPQPGLRRSDPRARGPRRPRSRRAPAAVEPPLFSKDFSGSGPSASA